MSMDDHGSIEKWLVRTEKNTILGPFSREELQQMILEGSVLTPLDEICRGNSYWINLQEADELQKQLGVRFPKFVPIHDEDTETETERIDLHSDGIVLPVKDLVSHQDSFVVSVKKELPESSFLRRSVQKDAAFLFRTAVIFLVLLAMGIFLAMNWILRKV